MKLFNPKEIETTEKNLSEIAINYRDDITKIPGLFATIANELALNEVSIIDSMICHWEHIIVAKEKDLEGALKVILNLIKSE